MFGFVEPAVYNFSDLTKLNHLFKKIYTALKSDRLYGNYYAGGFAYDYLVEFYCLANNKSTAEESESNQTIITAVNYIDSHIKEDITLDQLSQARFSGVEYSACVYRSQKLGAVVGQLHFLTVYLNFFPFQQAIAE